MPRSVRGGAAAGMCRRSRNGHDGLRGHGRGAYSHSITTAPRSTAGADRATFAGDIAGYRTFVAIVSVNYFTLLVLTPRAWGAEPAPFWLLASPRRAVSRARHLGLRVSRSVCGGCRSRSPTCSSSSAIGMQINGLAPGGLLPLILLPIAAQAVALLPRLWAAADLRARHRRRQRQPDVGARLAGVVPQHRVGDGRGRLRRRLRRRRRARARGAGTRRALSAEVAQLAAANERNRLAREIHDTLGHYLTVIHVQLEAARAVMATEPERGMLAVSRAQALAKDGLDGGAPVGQGAARRQPRRGDRRSSSPRSWTRCATRRSPPPSQRPARPARSPPPSRSRCTAPRSRRSPTCGATRPRPRGRDRARVPCRRRVHLRVHDDGRGAETRGRRLRPHGDPRARGAARRLGRPSTPPPARASRSDLELPGMTAPHPRADRRRPGAVSRRAAHAALHARRDRGRRRGEPTATRRSSWSNGSSRTSS